MQLGQKLTVYSRQKSVHRAMAAGDISVIDPLVRDTMHTQHSPSASCCVCVVSRTKGSVTITHTMALWCIWIIYALAYYYYVCRSGTLEVVQIMCNTDFAYMDSTAILNTAAGHR